MLALSSLRSRYMLPHSYRPKLFSDSWLLQNETQRESNSLCAPLVNNLIASSSDLQLGSLRSVRYCVLEIGKRQWNSDPFLFLILFFSLLKVEIQTLKMQLAMEKQAWEASYLKKEVIFVASFPKPHTHHLSVAQGNFPVVNKISPTIYMHTC